jgi:hypothetical protein
MSNISLTIAAHAAAQPRPSIATPHTFRRTAGVFFSFSTVKKWSHR